MPIAKVVRIQPLNNGYNSDIDVSGFKLLYGDNQLDLSTAVVTSNFTPSQGSLNVFKRDTIDEFDLVTIPASYSKGGGYIYLTFASNIEFDAFQIGFANQIQRSLIKFNISYSTNGTAFTSFEEISEQYRLKFNSPYTFSAISSSTTGFPGFINLKESHSITSLTYGSDPFFELEKRRCLTNRTIPLIQRNYSYGSRTEFPVSSFLGRGKYYFEVETETIPNFYNQTLYMTVLVTDSTERPGLNVQRACFGFTNKWNGLTTNFWDGSLSQNPSGNYNDFQNITGFISGFTVDTTNGQIRVVNSPWIADFTFGGLGTYFSNAKKRVIFIVSTVNWSNSSYYDLTFNFGQKPFKFTPPTGFNDRIGQRWEMEIDPTYNTSLTFSTDNVLKDIKGFVIPESTSDNPNIYHDLIITPGFDHYVKGTISTSGNDHKKKKVSLLTWPEMEILRQQPSREIDGQYEFLYLEDRAYAVISQDLIEETYQPEIIGPVFPIKMEPTNG